MIHDTVGRFVIPDVFPGWKLEFHVNHAGPGLGYQFVFKCGRASKASFAFYKVGRKVLIGAISSGLTWMSFTEKLVEHGVIQEKEASVCRKRLAESVLAFFNKNMPEIQLAVMWEMNRVENPEAFKAWLKANSEPVKPLNYVDPHAQWLADEWGDE